MARTKDTHGKVAIISGPSGVGKSTICRELVKRLENVYLSVSMTTREKSEEEVDGKDYWFVSEEDFRRRIDEGLFLEYAEVFGSLYGTPADKIEEAREAGKLVLLEIDVQGARQVKAVFADAAMIFILPPSAKILAERLDGRGRDAAEVAAERLMGADAEIAAAWRYYEHMVINDNLAQAVDECVKIIENMRSANRQNNEG
ncbi:MAG: guanylate kinase [Sedimentisphaerales bacterium]|nr:guanylate kinase [Sedimentisphaerales bacterium]